MQIAWIPTTNLHGNRLVVTCIWERFFFFQEPRHRQTSLCPHDAEFFPPVSFLWCRSMEGVSALPNLHFPNMAIKPKALEWMMGLKPLRELLSSTATVFLQSVSFSTILKVLNFWNILFGILSCCYVFILEWKGFQNFCCCCSVNQSCPTLCNPMDCSTPGLPVLHQLLKFAQVHVLSAYFQKWKSTSPYGWIPSLTNLPASPSFHLPSVLCRFACA